MKKLLVVANVFLLMSCVPATENVSDESADADTEPAITVATSFYPLTHVAEQIGKDLINVYQISAQGADPHTYEPTPQQIGQVYNADLLIFNGQGQDPWADKMYEELKSNNIEVIIATDVVDLLAAEDEHDEGDEAAGHTEEEGEEHEDDHGEWDPHVWLDPVLMKQITDSVLQKLILLDPANALTYESNAQVYISLLEQLDADLQSGLQNCALDAVIVSHDAFRYFANRYNFETLEISGLSPSAEPSPSRLAELVDLAEKNGIRHVFFETHVSPALSQTLADEIGAETLVLHSIEALTEEERNAGQTYLDIMRQNLTNLRTAMQCS